MNTVSPTFTVACMIAQGKSQSTCSLAAMNTYAWSEGGLREDVGEDITYVPPVGWEVQRFAGADDAVEQVLPLRSLHTVASIIKHATPRQAKTSM